MQNNSSEQQEGKQALPASRMRRTLMLFFRLSVRLLFLFTIYLTCGRVLMPMLGAQKARVEAALSESLGSAVQIVSIQGSWFRFSPGLSISELFILPDPRNPDSSLAVGSADVRLDLWQSLRRRQLIFSFIRIRDMKLALEQSEEGRWHLLGMEPGDAGYTDRLLDLMLTTPAIAIAESELLIKTRDRELSLDSLFIQIENSGQDHLLNLQFRIGDNDSPLLAMLELQGDPRQEFTARSWLKAPGLDLQQELSASLPPDWQLQKLDVDGELWADFSNSGLDAFSLDVRELDLLADRQQQPVVVLENASFSLSALPDRQDQQQKLNLGMQDVNFDWHARPWMLPALYAEIPMDTQAGFRLQAEQAEVAMLADIAASLPLPEPALEALATLAPTGILQNVILESAADGSYPEKFLLQSNFSDLAVQAWQSAPSGSGLSGYTEVTAAGGFAEVKASDVRLHLPRLFNEEWHYDSLQTRVDWQANRTHIHVSSTPIQVVNENLKGRVQFFLDKYLYSEDDRHAEFGLLVGMDYMDVAVHSAYLPTLENIAPTMQWLDAALQGGRIVDSGFVLRAAAGLNTLPFPSMQASWYRVENAELKFSPDWPAVSIGQAGVLVRDNLADVSGSNAEIGGLPVEQAKASLRPGANGPYLSLQVQADADTGQGIGFLRTTPLRDSIGGFLDNWQASGRLGLQVSVGLDLGAQRQAPQVSVRAVSENSAIHIGDYDLQVDGLNGNIRFSSATGLQSDMLEARVFARPVNISIDTLSDDQSAYIQVLGQGSVGIEQLSAWEAQPEFVRSVLDFASGELEYSAEVRIPQGAGSDSAPRLIISTDLQGVSTSLPAPFAKTAGEQEALMLDMGFADEVHELNLRYADFLSGRLRLNSQTVERGQLFFGGLNQEFTVRQTDARTAGLLVSGQLDTFDYEAWQQVAQRITDRQQDKSSALRDYLRLVDVNIGTLRVAGQELEDINVQVRHQRDAWHVYAMNALLAGDLLFPDEELLPWQVDLEYLRFPPRPTPDELADLPADTEEEDLLADINPAELPAFSFSTQELSIGDSDLGNWRFDLQPDDQGALITNLFMQEQASIIGGTEENTGATVDWRLTDGEYRSHFTGVFAAGDLSVVMPKWGHDANIVSRRARFSGALDWPGSPLAFSLKQASGDISLAITEGRFVDIESGSSRLLGAFNFDALIRRLELDFSDLYKKGFSFDSISGDLSFTSGVVTTSTPLLINGPSSRLTINGQVDLAAETIAADMQVRIPLGENLSLLAGLLGAWPLAVTTYLGSKIFSDQVEEFTSFLYRLEGPWSDPQAGFEALPKDADSSGE